MLIGKGLRLQVERCLVLLVSFICFAGVFAQDRVFVYGSMKDLMTSRKIPNGTVIIYKNGSKLTEIPVTASGKFEINLDYGAEYKLLWQANQFISKNIVINTQNVAEENRAGGHGMNIDITMLTTLPGIDFSLLEKPFGIAKYVPEEANFMWDMEYTNKMRSAQDKLLKDYEDKLKNAGKLEEDYKKAMADGEKAMKEKDFKKAVGAFNNALGIKPNDAIAKAKLNDAETSLKEDNAEAEREKQYQDLIKTADDLFKKQDFENAKGKYQEALTVKEAEVYPKSQIAECDKQIEELKKKAEAEKLAKINQEKYEAAISTGDIAFKEDRLEEAEVAFLEARELKPEEAYPKTKLQEIKDRKAELAAKAENEKKAKELQSKYESLIIAADASFNSAAYDIAKTKYEKAIELKGDESYPKEQLLAIQVKLEELAKAEEEERRLKEIQDNYNTAIVKANASFNAAAYEKAIEEYKEASAIKDDEQYPKDQLVIIQTKLEELKRQEEEAERLKALEEKYTELIAKADQAFDSQSWDESKNAYTEAKSIKPEEVYPNTRLAELQSILDKLAAEETERKKQEEIQRQYDAKIASADQAYEGQDLEAALMDYKGALTIIPGGSHPLERIKEIESKMDAAAQAKAEAERIKQEAEALGQRYNDLIVSGDRAFDQKKWNDATIAYNDALVLKPEEQYPTDRLRLIEEYIAAESAAEEQARLDAEQAERDRIAAEEAAKRNAAEEAARLAAEEAEAAARLAAEQTEQKRLAEEARLQQERYDNVIVQADKAFQEEDFSQARDKYKEALSIKNNESYPKTKLAEISTILAQRASNAEEQARLEEEARLAEEERLRKLREEERAARLTAETEKKRIESLKEQDADYLRVITEGDKAFAEEEYAAAKALYAQAVDIKPEEAYPPNQINRINKLLDELARRDQEAENARLAAEQTEREKRERTAQARVEPKESDAERFMREAREREEAEKYERIKKLKADVSQSQMDWGEEALTRTNDKRETQKQELTSAGLYQGNDDLRLARISEIERQKKALRDATSELNRRAREKTLETRSNKRSIEKDIAENTDEWSAKQAENVQRGITKKEQLQAQQQELGIKHQDQVEAAQNRAGQITAYQARIDKNGDDRARIAAGQIEAEKERLQRSGQESVNNAEERAAAARNHIGDKVEFQQELEKRGGVISAEATNRISTEKERLQANEKNAWKRIEDHAGSRTGTIG